MKKSFLALASLSLITGACGIDGLDIGSSSKDSGTDRQLTPITIPVNLMDMSGSLSLAAATSFEMNLDGCVSGFTAVADETTGALEVYKFDQNCLAKLTQFEVGGVIYTSTNAGAIDFTTWLAGDTATFTSAGGAQSIGVSVVTQLDNPVSGTEPIEYAFSTALAGSGDTIADTTVGDSHTITVGGDAAPDVEIVANGFVGMTATGAGQFTFDLECQTAIVGNDCTGSDMTAWSFALVQDTYAGSPTVTELNGFTYSGAGVADGAIGGNGGTATGTLQGPDAMHTNPNMLLVVKNGASYKYFDVDVTVLPANQATP